MSAASPWQVIRADLYECGRTAALWVRLPDCPDPSHPAGVAFDVEFGRDLPATIGGVPARQVGRDVIDYTLLRVASWPANQAGVPLVGSLPIGAYTVRLAYYRDGELVDMTDSLGGMDSHKWGHEIKANGGAIRCALPRPVRDGETLVAYLSSDWLNPPTNTIPGGHVFRPAAYRVEPTDKNFAPGGLIVVTGEPVDGPAYAPPRVAVMLYRAERQPDLWPGVSLPAGCVTASGRSFGPRAAILRDLRHWADTPMRWLPWKGTVAATIAAVRASKPTDHVGVLVPPGSYQETPWPIWEGCKLTIQAEVFGTVTINPGPNGQKPCGWNEGWITNLRELRLRGLKLNTGVGLLVSGDRLLIEDCEIAGPGSPELDVVTPWKDGGFGRVALVRSTFRDIADNDDVGRKSAVFLNCTSEGYSAECRYERAAFCRADFSKRSDQGQVIYSQTAVGRFDLVANVFDRFGGFAAQIRSRGCSFGNLILAGPFAPFIGGGSIVEDTCAGLTDLVGLDGVSNFTGDRAWGPYLNEGGRVPLIWRELRDCLNVHADSTLKGARAFIVAPSKVNQGVLVVDGNRHYAAGTYVNGATAAATPGARLGEGGGVIAFTAAEAAGRPTRPGDLTDFEAARDAFRVAWGMAPAPVESDPPTITLEVAVMGQEYVVKLPEPTYRVVVDGATVAGDQIVVPAGSSLSIRYEVVVPPPVVEQAPPKVVSPN